MNRRQLFQSINGFAALQLLPGAARVQGNTPLDAEIALELRRCITNAIATQPCYISVAVEDFEQLIMAQEGQCAFGFGYSDQARAAADIAIAHSGLGIDRLKQAAAVLVDVETPSDALEMHVSWTAVKHVKQQLQPDALVFYSHNTIRSGDGKNFRVSILATGISDKVHILRHKPTHQS